MYTRYQIRCEECQAVFNVAFGMVNMAVIAQPPTECPNCKCKTLKNLSMDFKETKDKLV